MRINRYTYSLKQGMKNIGRNRMFSLASIGTIAACIFLFGIFYFVVANFQYMIKTAETSVGVTVFFDKGLGDDEIKAIGEKIKLRKEVSSLEYTSAEEAWANYKKKYLSKELAESFGDDNPLADSASYCVYLNDVTRQKALVNYIKKLDGVRQVKYSESISDTFQNFNALVGYISAAIIILLLAVAVFLISTTVTMGISIRKEEISIMKLIGATDSFIRMPFIIEGIVIGLIGALLPLGGLYFIYYRIISFITERYVNIFRAFHFLDIKVVFTTLVPVALAIGIGIGFVGSAITVRRHLRRNE